MPYASGESPKSGDYVKNKREQPGTVTFVHSEYDGEQHVSIKWDDGGVDLPLAPAAEFRLLYRSGR